MTLGPLCSGCPLKLAGATGYAISRGTGKNGVAIVAEALGEDEAKTSSVLVGAAGKLTDRMISRVRDPENNQLLDPNDFTMTNIVRCRPPDNLLTGMPWEKGAIDQCRPYLEQFLAAKKPKVILACGNQPLRWFTGQWGVEQLRGYVFPSPYGPVVAAYHPSYVNRNKHALARVWQMDLKKALYIARHGLPPKIPLDYILRPTPIQFHAWGNDYLSRGGDAMLGFDIETPYASVKDQAIDPEDLTLEDDASFVILRISFAWEPGKAISVPWTAPYIETVKRLLAHAGPKAVWNRHFDITRLRANGCPVEGRVYDGMDMWHFLEPGLPMGLKYCATFWCPDMPAWKLEAHARPEWYNAADSDVMIRCMSGIRKRLEAQGRWDTFERHFVDLGVVLKKMSERGVAVDKERRAQAKQEFIDDKALALAELQCLVPRECRPVVKVYKKEEEWLRKTGKWEEGEMTQVTRLETPSKRSAKKQPDSSVPSPQGSSGLPAQPKPRKPRSPRKKSKSGVSDVV